MGFNSGFKGLMKQEGSELDLWSEEEGQMAGSCEHSNEISGSIQ